MKHLKIFISIMIFSLFAASCEVRTVSSSRHGKTIPPGQAKKVVGTKSAKPFAPGQRK